MRLQLKNFRCHVSADFTLPDTGMVLLTGSSGAGKTTILNAIEYALYGRTRKPYSHGKTTCSVTMDYTLPNETFISITRTSRPNRLVVTYEETEYEDEPAQAVIDGVMGMTFDEFMASSYIVQRLDSSILSMTPSEGVQFIETLAFNDNSHTETKKKIRNCIRESSDVVTSLSGELKVLERQAEAFDDAVMNITGDADETNEEITSIEKQIANITRDIKRKTGELADARSRERANKEARDKRISLEATLEHLTKSRSALAKTLPSSDEVADLEREVQSITDAISRDVTYASIQKDVARVNELKSSHTHSVAETLSHLKEQLLDDDTVASLRKTIDESSKLSEMANNKRRKDEAKKKVADIFKQIKTTFSDAKDIKTISAMTAYLETKTPPTSVMKCPSCDESLCLTDGHLSVVTLAKKRLVDREIEDYDGAVYVFDTVNQAYVGIWDDEKTKSRQLTVAELKQLRKGGYPVFPIEGKMKVADYIALLAETTSVDEESTITEEEYNSVREWIRCLTSLAPDMNIKIPEGAVFDVNDVLLAREQLSAYEATLKRVDELKSNVMPSSILKLEKQALTRQNEFAGYDSYKPSSYKSNDVSTRMAKLDEYNRVTAEHASITKEIDAKTRLLKSLTVNEVEAESERIENELTALNESIQPLSSRLKKLNNDLTAIKERERYEALQDELNAAKHSLREAESRLRGAQGLEETSKQAEILAVERTVESINEHAQVYLAEMFEDPITVRLESFKKAKSGEKPMMNVSIDYKGNTYGSVDELSGGERQRCNLAFLLAVNDMLNSPLLLLDECINNLDGEVNSQVLEIIKSTCDEGKLVLVVSHEAIQGCFDEIVNV